MNSASGGETVFYESLAETQRGNCRATDLSVELGLIHRALRSIRRVGNCSDTKSEGRAAALSERRCIFRRFGNLCGPGMIPGSARP